MHGGSSTQPRQSSDRLILARHARGTELESQPGPLTEKKKSFFLSNIPHSCGLYRCMAQTRNHWRRLQHSKCSAHRHLPASPNRMPSCALYEDTTFLHSFCRAQQGCPKKNNYGATSLGAISSRRQEPGLRRLAKARRERLAKAACSLLACTGWGACFGNLRLRLPALVTACLCSSSHLFRLALCALLLRSASLVALLCTLLLRVGLLAAVFLFTASPACGGAGRAWTGADAAKVCWMCMTVGPPAELGVLSSCSKGRHQPAAPTVRIGALTCSWC
jgi:hypothetical protein